MRFILIGGTAHLLPPQAAVPLMEGFDAHDRAQAEAEAQTPLTPEAAIAEAERLLRDQDHEEG